MKKYLLFIGMLGVCNPSYTIIKEVQFPPKADLLFRLDEQGVGLFAIRSGMLDQLAGKKESLTNILNILHRVKSPNMKMSTLINSILADGIVENARVARTDAHALLLSRAFYFAFQGRK